MKSVKIWEQEKPKFNGFLKFKIFDLNIRALNLIVMIFDES